VANKMRPGRRPGRIFRVDSPEKGNYFQGKA